MLVMWFADFLLTHSNRGVLKFNFQVPLHTIIEIQMGVTGVQEKRYKLMDWNARRKFLVTLYNKLNAFLRSLTLHSLNYTHLISIVNATSVSKIIISVANTTSVSKIITARTIKFLLRNQWWSSIQISMLTTKFELRCSVFCYYSGTILFMCKTLEHILVICVSLRMVCECDRKIVF